MNGLTSSLGWLMLQITAVGLVAWLLEARLARRCPGAAAQLAIAFAAAAILTAAAFAPLPGWWTWQRSQPPAIAAHKTAPFHGDSTIELAGQVPEKSLRWWFQLGLPKALPVAAPAQVSSAGQWLGAFWLIGAALALSRLALAILIARRIRRQSRLISDVRANELLSGLANDLRCRRKVELREADLQGLPATAGWLRPVILLPPDWREWSGAELRAALVHELAHICACDYLTNIIARLTLAWHFYHPLMRWLLARMQLRQELAADALGARHAGGPRDYLRALAALALRSQSRGAGGPARLFLSAHGGALSRRVEMLRNPNESRPVSRAVRGVTLALMLGVVVSVSAVRGPAQPPKPAEPAAAAVENNLEPFDLTYVSLDNAPESRAILAFRPSVILAQPGMEKYCRTAGLDIQKLFKKNEQGNKLPKEFTLENIDQIVADVRFQTEGSGEAGSRSVSLGTENFMIRMRVDVDWEQVLKALFGDIDVKQHDGKTFYTIQVSLAGPFPMTLYAPDKRTLVPAKEKDGKPFAPLARDKAKPRDLGPAWKNVERAHFVYAYDNRDGWWSQKLAADLKDFAPAQRLAAAENACMGVWFADGIQTRLFIQNKGEDEAKSCHEALEATRLHIAELLSQMRNLETTETAKATLKAEEEFLKSAKLEREGSQVRAEAEAKIKLADLVPKVDGKVEAKVEPKP